ncbi:uncharacterized protein [Misgurnus anguillicaudatus]|uniref:uncharacterized protein n=1 Tax=Misgurnus anguillicaudatus TaxID=75329 RepID=UPI003CCF4206
MMLLLSERGRCMMISLLVQMKKTMLVRFLLILCLSAGVFGVVTDDVKSVSVMEGHSVTLHTDLTEIQRDDNVIWTFGKTLLVNVHKEFQMWPSFDGADGRFKNRLGVDSKTGSLTVKNINTSHSGNYYVFHKNASVMFRVTVYAHLPIPIISREASSSKCVLLCSVLNGKGVTLSWYKGNSLLSNRTVSDLNIRLSLPLEMCSDYIHCLGFTEALIQLVLSTLVGVVTFAVVVYDIRCRRVEQDRRDHTSQSDLD